MTALLELDGVDARYAGVQALHGVSLRVDDGESVAILGANGAGKTSTLRAISGTVRRSGKIVFDGKPIHRKSPEAVARLGIAHVPEGREIYAELTVWENLLIGANHRRNWREAKRDCENVAGYFPRLEGRRNQQAGTLSGGEQQMLALGRALVARPKLLLLDEPSLGLAPTIVRDFYELVSSLTREMGLTVLVVEQNAGVALASTKRAYVLEVGRVVLEGTSEGLREDERVKKVLPGLMDWSKLVQTIVTGLADGGIYAVLALALVLIHRATGVINFAQGEMAMFSTYIAFWLISDPEGWQLSFWIGFGITLALSFAGGAAVYGAIIRPLARSGEITIVIATIALLIILNGAAGWIWTTEPQYIQTPFPFDPVTVGDVVIPKQTLYILGISLLCVLLVYLIFRFTRTGLMMRAAAVRADTSRLLGIRVTVMLALGWGLAAALGAVAGLMAVVATPPLDPNYMLIVIVYAFAAAVLGGLDSPIGAVLGAYILGVGIALLQTYVGFVATYQEFKLPIALGVLLIVLIVKPDGLFGRTVARRV